MMIIKCKMCGGDIELSEDRTHGICSYCGSAVTLPRVDDEQRAAAFNRGNHFRRIGDFDKALAVYETLLRDDDSDAEAHWCCALCRFGIEYVEDPASHEFLPTCHRASYDSFLEDVDYLSAVEHSDGVTRRQYEKDGAKIEDVRRRILAASNSEDAFDVFICYKETGEDGQRTVDSTLAQDIYYQLTEQGRRVFFARITLEDKAGQEYEPYIFAALNSARVMVVVGTKPEHLNAVWVKNEWSRFLALMKKDRKKLLIPCYRDMDPYDLPEQLSVLQSHDMSRIGFIQDLLRGIGKVLDDGKPQQRSRETVSVPAPSGGGAEAMLKRGWIALEDGDWTGADGFFEQALNVSPECGEAYLGKALAQRKIPNLAALVEKHRTMPEGLEAQSMEACPPDDGRLEAISGWKAYRKYLSDAERNMLQASFDRIYLSYAPAYQGWLEQEQAAFAQDKLLARAVSYGSPEISGKVREALETIFTSLSGQVEDARSADEANAQRIKEDYAAYLERMEELSKDAVKKGKKISQTMEVKDRKNRRIFTVFIVILIAVAALAKPVYDLAVTTKTYILARNYTSGRIADVPREAMRFGGIVNFLDSRERSLELWNTFLSRKTMVPGMAIKEDGTVETLFNTDVSDLTDIVAVTDGPYVLRSDGAVLSVFGNSPPDTLPKNIMDIAFTPSSGGYNWAADPGGGVMALCVDGKAYLNNQFLHGETLAIFADEGTYAGITTARRIWLAGDDSGGKRAAENWAYHIKDVAIGKYHVVGLTGSSTVLATEITLPEKDRGQSDVQDWEHIVDIAAGGLWTVGLKSDGTVVTAGDISLDPEVWTDIVAIEGGDAGCLCGLKSDGTVVTYGGYDSVRDRVPEMNVWTGIKLP